MRKNKKKDHFALAVILLRSGKQNFSLAHKSEYLFRQVQEIKKKMPCFCYIFILVGQFSPKVRLTHETNMFKAGTLPLNMYRTSDYPKDKVLFSPNTVEEQPATSAATVKPFISHEAIEDGQVAE